MRTEYFRVDGIGAKEVGTLTGWYIRGFVDTTVYPDNTYIGEFQEDVRATPLRFRFVNVPDEFALYFLEDRPVWRFIDEERKTIEFLKGAETEIVSVPKGVTFEIW